MRSGRVGQFTIGLGGAIVLVLVGYLALVPYSEPEQAAKTLQANPDRKPNLPDFSAIADVDEKKRQFFEFLQPMVARQNEFIRIDREFLIAQRALLLNGASLSPEQVARIESIASAYQYNFRQLSAKTLKNLLMRVDLVPENMVLIQAANETGWGSSRFAREGNNFFGQWCFRKGCGLVPNSRTQGLSHEVAVFNSVEDSVGAYLKNLNTNAAYLEFRQLRAGLRDTQQELSAEVLIHGLIHYSERQQEYIDELLQMLKHNSGFLS
ncbi:glucosaminidase domain-containing protein [Paraferrimonas sedimenticola]|uniref:Glycoside hydrolase family 73 n=1 Tax=Paraferrimonas sedimenticola TaxID=375674 RepID=A0AA37RWY6_9GAMM|nr:glucosaminidase domain-containing protein [Paraferrimonas sedimenticola]GLP96097.1 glycoside hydrolase family 73 [Paraferrimonas sedimenticola]